LSDLRFVLNLAAPHRGVLALCIALMVGESAAALAMPWFGGRLADLVLQGGSAGGEGIRLVLLGMLGVFAAQALMKFAGTYLHDSAADRIVADLMARLYDHLQALPLAYFHRRQHGDTLALLTTDVHVLSGFIGGTLLGVVPFLLTAAGTIVLMYGIRPDLAVLVAVLIPLFYLLTKVLGRRLRPLSSQLQNEEGRAVAIAEENLGMLPAIKTYTREAQESARYRGQIDRILDLSARQRRVFAALEPLVHFIAAAAVVLVLWFASADLLQGQMSAGDLVSFLLYAQLLTRPVSELADLYGQTQRARGALSRLQAAMAEPPEPALAGRALPAVKGEIEFHRVGFSYPGRPPALRDLTLRIAAGETIAIVGPNGAGKSTLAHLLMRLHDPSAGRIAIDGIDIATVSLHDLRRQIGVVPQHTLLFNASVHHNIGYGRAGADLAAIEAAARVARIHDFIAGLAQGYDTVIGDRGVRLSGGQQQRVALARALLKDPPILILDEATAMFDPQGEAEFLEACRDTLRRRTVLLITHRPAALAVADRVVRMENGSLLSEPDAVPAASPGPRVVRSPRSG
jgi:subfamily B ATP-binding cassette protein MsbA